VDVVVTRYFVRVEGREHVVEVHAGRGGQEVLVDGVAHPVDVAEVEGAGLYSLLIDRRSVAFAARFENGEAVLSFHDREVRVAIEDERTRLARAAMGAKATASHAAEVKSVMPGVVKEVRVQAGQAVTAGEALLILEAMKMENEVRAPGAGRVERVHVAPGTAVEKGARLVTLAAPGA
jgi:pyruvate carboxylase subunit B